MNPNAQASRQRIAGMLARYLGNSAMFDCSPAKATLPGGEAPGKPLSSVEGILAGSRTAMATFNSGGKDLAGVAHPVRWLSSGQLPFAKNDNLQHKVPKTKRVAGSPETSGHRQLFFIV